MPIFKVCLLERTKRVMVKANNLEELKAITATKFGLPDEPTCVVLEEDGTEIDDTDVLIELASSNMMSYMLLTANQVWLPPQPLSDAPIHATPDRHTQSQPVDQLQTSSPASPLCSPSTSSETPTVPHAHFSHQLVVLNIPWDDFPDELKDCRENKIPNPGDRREVVKIVGKYIVWNAQQTARSVVETAAKAIVVKYPTMGDRIGDRLIGKGHESLMSQLYNKVMFENRIRKNKVKASGSCPTQEDLDEPAPEGETPTHRKGKRTMADTYGCVQWQPQTYPEGETAESQEEKRLLLINAKNSQLQDNDDIKKYMELTYVTQRSLINKKMTIEDIIQNWPFLAEEKYLTLHFSTLTGNDMHERWMASLNAKSESVVRYIRGIRNNKNREDILKIVLEMDQAVRNTSAQLPLHEAVVPAIALFLGEDSTSIYKLMKVTDTDEAIKESITVPTPVLIVLGSTLHDQNCKCLLIVENKILTRPATVISGFFLIVASYYVFNIAYPEACCATLEFMQRVFLDINPLEGDKRAGKRKKTTCHPKVLKLLNNLTAFTNLFAVPNI